MLPPCTFLLPPHPATHPPTHSHTHTQTFPHPTNNKPACSEHTIEENILKKSDQKRQLDWLAIQVGARAAGCTPLAGQAPKSLLPT